MNEKKNAILFSTVDREDFWVTGGLVFKVENTKTYEESYNEIKDKLESEEVVNYIIEEKCLLDDLFDGDETFKFTKTSWYRGLYFYFENQDGEEVDCRFTADYVWIP
jgi:hypothetical protein